MIGVAVGACGLGEARARHALGELAIMAGLPRAEGPPGVTAWYGRGAPADGPTIIIPHDAAHVAREVAPDVWNDGGVEVPVLFETPAPKGEVLARTAGGHPLLVRIGQAVHFGFDVAQAADYYLNGRGEVGWPRDADGRPVLAEAPGWRPETATVAVVNRYATLFARAAAAAAAVANIPVIRFKYWPEGARFALALSHDVDRLFAPTRREMVRSSLRARRGHVAARYTLRDILRGRVSYRPLPALFRAEEAAGGVSTFFIGARRRGEMDYDYDAEGAGALLREVAARGREVALHASYYSAADAAALAEERDALARHVGCEVRGVRGHYLRLAGEPGWAAAQGAGFAYDASFGFPAAPGWRGGAALPYRPFDAAGERAYDFALIPLAVMDGTLFQHMRLDAEAAFAVGKAVVDEAAASGGVCPLLWHYRAFTGGAFPAWGEVYRRLVQYAVAAGGLPLSHDAVARRYELNRDIKMRGPSAGGSVNISIPYGKSGDIVWEVSAGWRPDGEPTSTTRTFKAPPDVIAAGDRLALEL